LFYPLILPSNTQEQDPYLPSSNLDGIEEFVPQLTIKRISDGSHWIIHERPDLVNAHIRNFISP
jgi:epoxide hydrolase 4